MKGTNGRIGIHVHALSPRGCESRDSTHNRMYSWPLAMALVWCSAGVAGCGGGGQATGVKPPPTCTRSSIINVPAGGSFQLALDSAHACDTIVLQAGASYVGNFTLPVKPSSDQYVTVTTSAASLLPGPNQRVGPRDLAHMASLISNRDGLPVLTTVSGAHHYRFVGIEIAPAAGKWAYDIIILGYGETTLAALPHDFIFDRVYIHGDPVAGTKRGIGLNCANATVENSYISSIHVIGQDAQAIGGHNGPGPFHILNNYLEASGENVMFGGALASIPGLIPSDIEIRHNFFFKPLSWRVGDPSYAGYHWSIKNLLEFKNAQRVVIDGNIFENNWADAQVGFAVLYTVRTEQGQMPWAVVNNIQFTNNIVMHSGSGVNIAGRDNGGGQSFGGQVNNLLIRNNLFEDISSASWGGDGRLFQILSSANAVTIDHNVGLQDGLVLALGSTASTNAVFTNTISPHNKYGVHGDGKGTGTSSLNAYLPGAVFQHNVLIGGDSNLYPQTNYFPVTMADVGFANPSGGDYSLSASSRYRGFGTDGKDVGVDMSALNAATAGVIQGVR